MDRKQTRHPGKGRTFIKVKLLARSSKNQIMGREDDAYRVKVMSPPVDGKANKALIELLAKRLDIPRRSIEITSGKRSKLKTLLIRGLTMKEIRQRLDED